MGSNLNEAEIDFYTKFCALNLRDRKQSCEHVKGHVQIHKDFDPTVSTAQSSSSLLAVVGKIFLS